MAATRDLLVTGGATVTRTKKKGVRVNFTYQTDAADYNFHTSGYAEDAFSIALQPTSVVKGPNGGIPRELAAPLGASAGGAWRRS